METMLGRPVVRHSAPRMTKGRAKAKVHTVMAEFKRGALHSSSGHKVTSRDQAIAIAMHESGQARKKRRR